MSFVHFRAVLLVVCMAAVSRAQPTCSQCHRAISETYARTGMGRSFQAVKGGANSPEFDGKVFHHEASGQYFVPSKRDGKLYLRRYEKRRDGSVVNDLEKQVDYLFGSGNHARSYLSRTATGKLVEMPLTWYSENGGHWGMSPAYDRPDHSGFSREIVHRCMFCHNAYPEIEPGADDWDFASAFPGTLPEGIDCQRCHGPGRNHVEAVKRGASGAQIRAAIVNPSRLSPDRQMEVCLQCHLETTSSSLPATMLRDGRGVFSYRPGEPLANYVLNFDHARGTGHEDKFEIVSAAYRMRQSSCFQKSGRMTCTTCHNPHQALRGEEADRHYAKVCLGCHETAIRKLVSQQKHPAAQECVGCHMQKRRPSDVMHAVMTDHRILSRPVPEKAPVEEQHEGNTWPYSGEVVLYYPSSLPKTVENELDLALAQVVQQSNLPQGLERLEKAIRQYQPAGRAETYFQLADAWFRAGQISRSIPWYAAAVKRDPGRWRYLYSLGMALSAAGLPDRSTEALHRAQSLAPREPVILNGLADVDFAQGRLSDAISLLKRAIGLNPDLAEGPNNLGNALSHAGDLNGAAAALRDAARLRPEISSIRINLAGVLARQGKLSDAREELEKALQIGPSREEARSVYLTVLVATANEKQARAKYNAVLDSQRSDVYNKLGTVLVGLGDADAAVRHYRSAIAARPDSAAAHLNLGLTLAGQKKLAEAQQALETAVKYDPNLYEAHLKLGELLVAQGKADSAAAYLRKAALSPDPPVRKAATDLIRRSSAKSN